MAAISMNPVTVILLVFLAQANVDVCFGNGDSNILCIETEKQALLSFKRGLVDHSNKLVSWEVSEEEDCCKWAGIVCNSLTGHVSELRLKNGSLTGKINPSLLNLTHLSHLDLSSNDFGGINIPSFMGSLVSLKYLNLTNGGFKGMIPHQLGNLSSLSYFGIGNSFYDDYLYADNLHWLSGLSSLKSLDMNYVDLSEASDHWLLAINTLPSLLELSLSSCNLLRIRFPSQINLTSLERLDLSVNYLELGDPILCTFLNNMSLLKYLDLSFNYINSTIPSCLYSFPSLKHLNLSETNLHGVISSSIANLTSIVSLDLSYNNLGGEIPTSMGNLCNLEAIDLGYNYFNGKISKAFESLSGCLSNRLKSLTLGTYWESSTGNGFTGQIPDEIGEFKNLVYLSLRGNKIYGPIPNSIFANLLCLKTLFMGYNNLSGSFPQSLGSLTSLESLDISNNQLNGSLPKSLGSLSNLEFLDISSNHFEGIVSEAHFATLTKLTYLAASRNLLSLKVSPYWIPPFQLNHIELRFWNLGPQFPMWLRSQKNLFTIDLSNTGILDVIPNWFWNLTNGGMIDLSRNQIHGNIPDLHHRVDGFSAIYLISNKLKGPLPRIPAIVEELDLSNNSLSGDLSHFLCDTKTNRSKLHTLNLKDNLLSGRIPDCWMYWPSLVVIDLGNNNLSGEIPSSMGSLDALLSLSFGNNSLSGETPKPLQNCAFLMALNLGMNKFVGTIPKWIGSLQNLNILVLRSNNLRGHFPIELCALSQLQILDTGNNNLSGTIPKCFKNFTAMTTKSEQFEASYVYYANDLEDSRESAMLVIKGREDKYDTILALVSILDLSSNNLHGEIPKELTSLQALQSLNLSGNYLSGRIPDKIGNITGLEALDLSRNQLTGNIPPGMSSLTFLNYLNLSYNNLSGEIPTSTQLQSLEASSFIGNQLCGPPLPISCTPPEAGVTGTEHDGAERASDEEEYWFRLGIGMGFVVGFLGVIAPLLVCGFWRRAYFWFIQEYLWYNILDYYVKFKYMMRN
ncbi:LRR domain containing protein [Trema orientale]|uniref:LRR domain containing protein n=1 Tax=Trema orientale TaxID=63057 RepID=A0A2P5CN43_TREOI|nr:LRR domain containing protein [Trema orientale]